MTQLTLEQPKDIETLQKARDQAYAALKEHLKRFGWSAVPRKSDPDGQAFWNDPIAVEAAKTHSRVDGQLYRLEHLAYYGEVSRRYRNNHPEQVKAAEHKYRLENLEECQERERKYQRDHPDDAKARSAAWYKDHPDRAKEIRRLRRARLTNAEGSFTEVKFRALCREYNDRCGYCNGAVDEVGPLEADHMMPLSRGGSDDISNIIPSCKHCNDSKGNKTVKEFLQVLERQRRSTK